MAKKEDELKQAPEVTVQEEAVIERPNRDKYSSMFAEDNPDVDFEDKEARYGRMAQEREDYRNLKKSGSSLSQALDKNRWIAAMFQDLAKNPEKNPLAWLAENGIDIKAALDDPEVMSQVDEKFKAWQQKQVDGEASQKALDDAIENSWSVLEGVQKDLGLSDEQVDRMWAHFWDEVFQPAFNGEVKKETWEAMVRAMNYDQDVANAREEGAIQARNEKHANKVKTFDEENIPPSFSQGQGRLKPKEEKPESLKDFVKKYTS